MNFKKTECASVIPVHFFNEGNILIQLSYESSNITVRILEIKI